MKLLQKEGNKSAICTFEDYKSLTSSQIFSYIRKLNLSSNETGTLNLELDFSKVKIGGKIRHFNDQFNVRNLTLPSGI